MTTYNIRQYRPADYPTLSAWWIAHGRQPAPENLLPDSGWILESDQGEPFAAAFAFCAVGIGVAHVEWIVAKPGLNTSQARECFRLLFVGVKQILAGMDYSVIIVNCPVAIARDAEKYGLEVCSTKNVNMIGLTL